MPPLEYAHRHLVLLAPGRRGIGIHQLERFAAVLPGTGGGPSGHVGVVSVPHEPDLEGEESVHALLEVVEDGAPAVENGSVVVIVVFVVVVVTFVGRPGGGVSGMEEVKVETVDAVQDDEEVADLIEMVRR